MVRRAGSVGALALGAALALVGGCAKSPDRLQTTEAEHRITTALTRTIQRHIGAVSCPDDIELARGSSFRCEVEVDGEVLPVKAVQRDDRGSLRVEPQAAVIRTDAVSTDLVAELEKQFGRTFTTDCGPAETRILKPGTTFTCQATDGSSKRVVTVKVVDVSGTLTYDVGGGATPGTAPDGSTPGTMVPAPSTTAPVTTPP
jgi:hypothetical protein